MGKLSIPVSLLKALVISLSWSKGQTYLHIVQQKNSVALLYFHLVDCEKLMHILKQNAGDVSNKHLFDFTHHCDVLLLFHFNHNCIQVFRVAIVSLKL